MWISTEGRYFQLVDVKGNAGATLFLGPSIGNAMYRVDLQQHHSDLTILTNLQTGQNVTKTTPHLLSDTHYTTIWFSWGSNTTIVGTGPVAGEHELVRLADEHLEHMAAVGLATDYHEVDWMIFRQQRMIIIKTE